MSEPELTERKPSGEIERVPAKGLDVRLGRELIERARAEGVSLTGEGGLLASITRQVLQAALEAEMSDHLGYEKGDPGGAGSGNHRNGSSRKTVLTEVGAVELAVPRDRAGTFEPRIVPKHSRRVEGFDEAIVSLYAKGLTTGEIQAHLAEIYDVTVSRELISKVTDRVVGELTAWQNRPLDRTYAVLMIDAIVVKIRDGAVANRPVYVAVGINLEGERDVLGMWVGTGGEGAKTWMTWLAELRNRGVQDVLVACCDGLKDLPKSINDIWPLADVQLCVVHMVRASLRYASRKHWPQIAKELRHVYTAPTQDAADARFREFEDAWGKQYPAMVAVWNRNWEHFVMFLRFPPEIRKIVYTTNVIESLNARFRQATRRRGHFPDEQAALKVLYLAIRSPRPGQTGVTGRTRDWKQAINSLAGYYGDRITAL